MDLIELHQHAQDNLMVYGVLALVMLAGAHDHIHAQVDVRSNHRSLELRSSKASGQDCPLAHGAANKTLEQR